MSVLWTTCLTMDGVKMDWKYNEYVKFLSVTIMCEIDELIHEDPTVEPSPGEIITIGGNEPEPIFPEPIQEPIPGPDPVSVPEPNVIPDPVPSPDPYNETEKNTDGENELGSCDCRSECRYNTGESGKYRDYGFWP